jgi:hypothetical protein
MLGVWIEPVTAHVTITLFGITISIPLAQERKSQAFLQRRLQDNQ